MAVYTIDPLRDERWPEFLDRHPDASVFHTPGWLQALYCTYGYEPMVYTTNQPGETLTNGIPFCSINSWLTGRRLVSVPFSDHCQPLVNDEKSLSELLTAVSKDLPRGRSAYIELRPVTPMECAGDAWGYATEFYLQCIDISIPIEEIFANFNRNSVRRKINNANLENIEFREGVSESLLKDFHDMLLMTRQKHGVPPQPIPWFQNLIKYLGSNIKIRVAYLDGTPLTSTFSIHYKHTYVSKYACSNSKLIEQSGTPTKLLLWQAIQEAKELGCTCFDLGRSDMNNKGLCDFKEYFGCGKNALSYYRYPATQIHSSSSAAQGIGQRVFEILPNRLLATAGTLLYKHFG